MLLKTAIKAAMNNAILFITLIFLIDVFYLIVIYLVIRVMPYFFLPPSHCGLGDSVCVS